jgi:transcription elongation factor Elf1
MEINLPLNIVYDRTLNNCPECGSDNTSLLFLILHQQTSKPIKKSEENCKDCGFTSEYKFELLNKINRRSEKIDKILDK